MALEPELIVDAHVHITSPDIIADEADYRKSEPYFDLLSGSPKNKFATCDDLVARMDADKVHKAVVFGFAFNSMELCRRVNDYTIEAVRRFPDRLIGFAVVNPRSGDAGVELGRCLRAGLRGAGEMFATGQGFDLADKGQMEPVCDFCREHRWPLLVHLNEPVGHDYLGKTGDSLRQGAALAANYPDVTLILAHLGGGLCFYELMPELRKCLANTFYDTAAQPFLYSASVYDSLKAAGVLPKILFGSDYPLLSTERYRREMDSARLGTADRAAIMGGNAAALLGL